MKQTGAYFDGDKTTTTEATETSLCLLKRAHSWSESYTILLILLRKAFRKSRLIF